MFYCSRNWTDTPPTMSIHAHIDRSEETGEDAPRGRDLVPGQPPFQRNPNGLTANRRRPTRLKLLPSAPRSLGALDVA